MLPRVRPNDLPRFLASALALSAATSLWLSLEAPAFTTTGETLPVPQRFFLVFNNFTDPSANDNTVPDPNWPGATGAPLAFWKAAIEWSSELHGDGSGDPSQPGDLGSGGADFDLRWAGLATSAGNTNGNTISELAGSSGGVLAYIETPIADGWRMFFNSGWTWDDGPGAPVQGAIDLQAVSTYEFGRLLGLGNSNVVGATMGPTASGDPLEARSIEADDQAGVQFLYGVISPTKPHVDAALTSGGSVTIVGRNFTPAGNSVRFLGALVSGVPSSAGGRVISLPLPPAALAGDVQVQIAGGTNGAWISNGFPFDPNGCPIPADYGTPKQNSQGCMPAIGFQGTPSASSPQPFSITASLVINQKTGLLLYAFAPASTPFQGGTLWIGAPLHRTPAQNSGGNVGPPDCSGTLALDFNARIQSGIDPALTAGTTVFAQYHYRDPADPFGVGLTDALAFSICP